MSPGSPNYEHCFILQPSEDWTNCKQVLQLVPKGSLSADSVLVVRIHDDTDDVLRKDRMATPREEAHTPNGQQNEEERERIEVTSLFSSTR